MNEDFIIVEKRLNEYIKIIFEEFEMCIDSNIKQKILDKKSSLLKWSDDDSISFVVRDGILRLPKTTYEVINKLKKLKNYGTRKREYDTLNYFDTSKTYMDYINEVIECGLSPLDYFLESLLHETMHVCGSAGYLPLAEGINELKTRELAEKRNIKISAFGYPKEVEVALLFQNIVGKEVVDQLTFIPPDNKYRFLETAVGKEVADLYKTLNEQMNSKVNREMFSTKDPVIKAKIYSQINYDEEKTLICDFIDKKSRR